VKGSFLTLGGTRLPAVWAGPRPAENRKIEYIRKNIPEFEIPPYRGTRYEDQVPDTLDIAERSKLGINCLTGITDPNADREIYWYADFFRNPPVMLHDYNDWCLPVEGISEALPLLRIATGSDLNGDVDRVWMETLLKSIGPDGLYYVPLKGRPWGRLNHCYATPVWRADGTVADPSNPSVTQISGPAAWARTISAMTVYCLRDQNPVWKQTIEAMIARISELASDEGDYAFIPAGCFEPRAKFSGGGAAGLQAMPTGLVALDGGNVRLIQGLAQYYHVAKYEPAQELAKKIARFITRHSDGYDAQGRFRFSAGEKFGGEWMVKYSHEHGGHSTLAEINSQTLGGHFHGHTIGTLALTEYAAAVSYRALLDWCKSSYEWAKTQGSSLVGFFPEMIVPDYPSCESCEVADMIAIALKLTQAGAGDYWDDVDRWTRNQFAENQLTDGDWIYRLAETMPKTPVEYNENADQLVKRNLGAFAGWASGNEWALHNGIMHCCTGNSTRALYYVWENIVTSQGDELRVNLLLNRASAWTDVYSFIPYEGRVKVKLKKPCGRVLVRAPEWIESASRQLSSTINGSPRELRWEGRYVNVGAANPGETIDLTFPIPTRTVQETLGTVRYTLEIKGNTVVSIDPPGKFGALYERANYKLPQAPFRKVQRFVPEEHLDW
jgi:hypothetical protein